MGRNVGRGLSLSKGGELRSRRPVLQRVGYNKHQGLREGNMVGGWKKGEGTLVGKRG